MLHLLVGSPLRYSCISWTMLASSSLSVGMQIKILPRHTTVVCEEMNGNQRRQRGEAGGRATLGRSVHHRHLFALGVTKATLTDATGVCMTLRCLQFSKCAVRVINGTQSTGALMQGGNKKMSTSFAPSHSDRSARAGRTMDGKHRAACMSNVEAINTRRQPFDCLHCRVGYTWRFRRNATDPRAGGSPCICFSLVGPTVLGAVVPAGSCLSGHFRIRRYEVHIDCIRITFLKVLVVHNSASRHELHTYHTRPGVSVSKRSIRFNPLSSSRFGQV